MSDSRLEKFIYAICSMDVSDLPVPLSRIEKLWNCLITGEIPDFEPLSRNEKYLMAMLDRYDISNLPAPMSRGEKLLYKIAVGETDLSDVPGYLSRYEELLKYLIENGGISGGDFEYVLHMLNQSLSTLYTTAEKPVKSAILSGQTLVNLSTVSTLTSSVNNISVYDLKDKCKYLFKCDVSNPNGCQLNINFNFTDGTSGYDDIFVGPTFTKGSILKIFNFDFVDKIIKNFNLYIANNDGITLTNIQLIEYQDGMENWDIPYFEGMQSVKLPVLTTVGKNQWIEQDFTKHNSNSSVLTNTDNGFIVEHPNQISEFIKTYINLKKGTWTISFDVEKTDTVAIGVYLQKGNVYGENITKNILVQNGRSSITYTSSNDIENACFFFDLRHQGMLTISNIQLEQGSVATAYEPYKTNILSTSEEVVLREVNGVKDTLNLMTGEYVQRIDEIVLDGSEKWEVSSSVSKRYSLEASINSIVNATKVLCICDKFPSITTNQSDHDKLLGITITNGTRIMVNTNYDTIDEFKQYLQQNPATVQYELATESIKTVDLTTVDQDNQPTQLGTFENITHVSLESAGLIPEVEMEVATRISKELASASPLMDDISMKQEQLNTTVDEQSNNVDATMIATTEIYEEIL